jgi:two-component system phosphate regulon sensor histidine kinase PhoR
MSENGAFTQAQAKVAELLENAKKGNIIPIRLPAQIEEIVSLLAQATTEHEKALQEAKSAAPVDLEAYMKEEAYFVTHAVHELRIPMTSIRGYSDMLGQMGELNDMQKQFLGTIRTNVRRMEGLMTDVSTVNKIRKNTLKLSPKMDMFKNIAMKLEKELMPVAQELNRQLVFEVPSGLPILNVDSDLFVQALTKIIENGLRYSPAEIGTVTVAGSAEDNQLVIRISDNGIGMTPEELAKLGTIFFRAENDVVYAYKGSGLGIPIAYGILNKLGANISVESEVNKGTTFIVKMAGMS